MCDAACDDGAALSGLKRDHDGMPNLEGEPSSKKTLLTDESTAVHAADQEATADGALPPLPAKSADYPKAKKKKAALLVVYNGKGYFGVQRNKGFATIENHFLPALVKAGVIKAEDELKPQSIRFQRASRTDKGVSAAGQVFSLMMWTCIEDAVQKINASLPEQIRVVGLKRATRGFDAKNACSHRTYEYLLPTFAFGGIEQPVVEDYRVQEATLTAINKVFAKFKGTHNFHNFTSGKKANDRSNMRYIIDFQIGKPMIMEGMEFAVITIKGQSFMMHQIRKMIGLSIAIVKGLASEEVISKCWGPDKVDVPKAPGLGLLLDKLHYDAYNKRYANDGVHEAIQWDSYQQEIDKFKQDCIYASIVKTEKEEKSMWQWLQTLPLHKYEMHGDAPSATDGGSDDELLGEDDDDSCSKNDQAATDKSCSITSKDDEHSSVPESLQSGTA